MRRLPPRSRKSPKSSKAVAKSYAQAVPEALEAPGAAFAHGQGARKGWILAASTKELLAWLLEQAHDHPGIAELSVMDSAPLACNDLKAMAAEARGAGKLVAVDVTGFGPEGCPAVRLGAHVSVMRITDGLCAVALSKDATRIVEGLEVWLDGHAATGERDLQLACRALAGEATRWHEASDAAQVLACYLRCHPRVAELRYPGLKQDESFSVAARTLQQGFGPRVDVRLEGSCEWTSIECSPTDPREQVLALEGRLRLAAPNAV